MNELTAESQFLSAALLAYVAAGTTAIAAVVMSKRPERTILTLMTAGLGLHSASLALRWVRLGHGPFVTLFEILSSNIWSLLLVFAVAYWLVRALRPAAAVVIPILFVMMGWLLVASPEAGHLPPTYHTIWLYIHVALGKIFLGAVLVAVGISGIVLMRSFGIGGSRFAALPDNPRLDNLAFRFMVLGFIFESLMLVAGAIWAQGAWGRYWAWDPLETWAFATWLALAFYLHLRVTMRLRPSLAATGIIAIFVLAFLTFFGVPFVSTAPHKGAV